MQNVKEIAGLIKRGFVLFDNKDYSGAIRFYDKALELDHNNIVALYDKSLALDRLGRYQEAITCYDKILDAKPDFNTAFSKTASALTEVFGKFIIPFLYHIEEGPPTLEWYVRYCKADALRAIGKHKDADAIDPQLRLG